ncbi:MAG TPA: hypothetical protein G4O04_03735 [Anaerolineae bacterium]|nr:hypothetical protein [Anaerolineae bacterium]HID84113.1 hypothetical protein [Anaerolineales bacterium]HIQ08637.1 hypothetical protein [Anaerolineaceae bacterium]
MELIRFLLGLQAALGATARAVPQAANAGIQAAGAWVALVLFAALGLLLAGAVMEARSRCR